MSVRRAGLAAIAVLVFVFFFYLRVPGSTPAGQPALLTLSSSNVVEFEKVFDESANVPRVVLLLSPT